MRSREHRGGFSGKEQGPLQPCCFLQSPERLKHSWQGWEGVQAPTSSLGPPLGQWLSHCHPIIVSGAAWLGCPVLTSLSRAPVYNNRPG